MARWRRAGLTIALAAMTAACGADVEQLRLCGRLIPALEEPGRQVEIVAEAADPEAENAVVVRYRSRDRAGAVAEHWLSCHFAGGGFQAGRLNLTRVETDRAGPISGVQLHLLRRFWLGLIESRGGDGSGQPLRGGWADLLYLLQQLVNSLVPACVYGLLAIGYTLVYGLIGRINLAFGEMATIGAYGTVIAVSLLAGFGGGALPLVLLAALAFAAALAALHGWATERLVFRPLRGAASQAPLIATIGLAVFLQEYLRLAQGSSERWLQPVLSQRIVLAGEGIFPVHLTAAQATIAALTLALYGLLWALFTRHRFGRNQRACAQDAGMAALCRVDVDRTVALTFSLGGACAGVSIASRNDRVM